MASGLRGVCDGEAMLLGQRVHIGAYRKVIRSLCAAMQHQDQTFGAFRMAGGQVKLVGAGSCGGAMRAAEILCASRDFGRDHAWL